MSKAYLQSLKLLRYILYVTLAILILLLLYYIKPIYYKIDYPESAVVAFPGAEGFGSATLGGRFGRIIYVSNLKDTLDINNSDYVGSLRWAIEHALPVDSANPYSQSRIIIFKVGGVIPLVDTLILKNPFVTIAGQTAPGNGITLKGNGLTIATHDVIVRGIRIRVGDQSQPTCCLDGINISTYYASSDVYNIIVDHSSVSWAIDENVSTWIDPQKLFVARDITIQWSIVSEGLHNSIHLDEGAVETDPHSMGAIFGQDGINMTIHHNVFSHNWARNPRISGIVNSEIINNVIYGWGNAAVEINGDKNITHVINNYFKVGTDSRLPEIVLDDPMHLQSQVYLLGNVTSDLRGGGNLLESRYTIPEGFEFANNLLFVPSNVTVGDGEEIYFNVLKSAGVIFPVRDVIDQRIINEIKTGAGKIIDSQNQVEGWSDVSFDFYPEDRDGDGIPSEWEISHDLDPNNAINPTLLAPTGYPWIEEYINSLIPHLE